MTRFARAKGSKASNERVPESATPWNVLKQDLKNSQNEANNKDGREKMNQMRQKNYANFIDEIESKVETTWAEFPVKKSMKLKKKKFDKNEELTENDVTDEMIDEFVKNDDGIEEYKIKIEKVLKNEKQENKIKKVEDVSDDDDDTPEEITAKVPPKEIVIKNKKNKLKKLQIKNEATAEDSMKTIDSPKEVAGKKQNMKKQGGNFQNNNKLQQKRKLPKPRDDKEHKRRKPDLEDSKSITVNSNKEKIVRFEGFPVLENDFTRLTELRKSLKQKGIPQSEIKRTMLLERRKAEKHLSRLKKHVCFNCRKSGHMLSECPELNDGNSQFDQCGTGICFKCGSTEHRSYECKSKASGGAEGGFKFARCFICREQGHIARECPDNPRGLYPQGGACKLCGDVTHLKKDCPTHILEQQEKSVCLNTISNNGRDVDSLDDGEFNSKVQDASKKNTPSAKRVKF